MWNHPKTWKIRRIGVQLSQSSQSSSDVEGKRERKRTGEGQATTSSHKSRHTATASSKLSKTVGSRSERQWTDSPRGSGSDGLTVDHHRPPPQLAQGAPGPRRSLRKRHTSKSTPVQSSTSLPRAFPGAHSPVPVDTSTPIQDPGPLAPSALPGDLAEKEIPVEPPLEDSMPAATWSIPLGLAAPSDYSPDEILLIQHRFPEPTVFPFQHLQTGDFHPPDIPRFCLPTRWRDRSSTLPIWEPLARVREWMDERRNSGIRMSS